MSGVTRTTVSVDTALWNEFLYAAQQAGFNTASGAVREAILFFLQIHKTQHGEFSATTETVQAALKLLLFMQQAQQEGKIIQIDGKEVVLIF